MRLPFSSGCVKRPGMDTGARMKRPLGKIRGGGARSGWTTAALFTDDPLEGFRHAEEDLVKAGLLRNLRNLWWFEPCQGESATIRALHIFPTKAARRSFHGVLICKTTQGKLRKMAAANMAAG